MDLLDPTRPLRLDLPAGGSTRGAVRSGPRTGVAGAGAPTPWRFWLDRDPTVSRYRPGRTAAGSPGARG